MSSTLRHVIACIAVFLTPVLANIAFLAIFRDFYTVGYHFSTPLEINISPDIGADLYTAFRLTFSTEYGLSNFLNFLALLFVLSNFLFLTLRARTSPSLFFFVVLYLGVGATFALYSAAYEPFRFHAGREFLFYPLLEKIGGADLLATVQFSDQVFMFFWMASLMFIHANIAAVVWLTAPESTSVERAYANNVRLGRATFISATCISVIFFALSLSSKVPEGFLPKADETVYQSLLSATNVYWSIWFSFAILSSYAFAQIYLSISTRRLATEACRTTPTDQPSRKVEDKWLENRDLLLKPSEIVSRFAATLSPIIVSQIG